MSKGTELERRITRTGYAEEDIANKRAELAELELVLAQLELELINLQAELRAFEIRYLQRVGYLISELDSIQAAISELLSLLFPDRPAYKEQVRNDREKAKKSQDEANFAKTQPIERTRFTAPEDLKQLYREVAKRVHPDFAADEQDRTRRSELMKQANQAFEMQDYEKLKELLDEADTASSAKIDERNLEREIDSLNKKILRVRIRIQSLRKGLEDLHLSQLYMLMLRVLEAENEGRDLLAEMAESLKANILERTQRLEELQRIYDERNRSSIPRS